MSIELTVKELSEITKVSPRNIRYYDDIGLVKCSGLLINGYRYYTMDKIEEMNIVTHLRHLGLPIKEIKAHMHRKDLGAYAETLNNQLQKVTHEIQELKRTQHYIKRRLSLLDSLDALPSLGEIHVQPCPEVIILRIDTQMDASHHYIEPLKQLMTENKFSYGIFIGDLGFIVDLKQITTRAADNFTGLYLIVKDASDIDAQKLTSFPQGDWLVSHIRGDHGQAHKHYKKMIAYAKNKGLQLADFATERTLVDHFISNDADHHITEIMIPILGQGSPK